MAKRDATNNLVYQLLGCSLLQIDQSWWAVRLKNDEWICEARLHTDMHTGVERHFEWYEDLVANDDVKDITELWLLCPPTPYSPGGNTARLPIIEPRTAFDFKLTHCTSNFVTAWKVPEAHVIGRVDDKNTGDCTCFIWDDKYSVLSQPYKTNIYNFGRWRDSIPEIREIAVTKMGVRL